MLGLEGTEQGLFGTQDLHRRRGLLGEVHERARVGDEARTHQLPHHDGEVGGDGLHAVGQVLVQRSAVLHERHDLADNNNDASWQGANECV